MTTYIRTITEMLLVANGDRREAVDLSAVDQRRLAEAVLFAAETPLRTADLAARLAPGVDVRALLVEIQGLYAGRGVALVETVQGWRFQTAADLELNLRPEVAVPRRLSPAALKVLGIIAYHQPITRAEIEEIRGATVGQTTIDILVGTGWVKLRGRTDTAGRASMWGTTDAFLEHFGLAAIDDLPGMEELRDAGLFAEPPAPTTLAMRPTERDAALDTDQHCPAGDSI